MRGALVAALLGAVGLVAGLALAAGPPDERRSGFDFMSAQSQALQKDDTANPAMLWVAEGAELWARKAGDARKACADCHEADVMKGVAARYPAFDAQAGAALDLTGRIARCQATRQMATPWPRESREMLAMAAFVGSKSRGLPIAPDPAPQMDAVRARGEALWRQRIGQLNLSCANCHDDHWGRSLAGAPIPQGHPTGYPLYRLEWQDLGSVQRRFRNCMTGVRAEPYAPGSPEFIALEAYMMARARGMPVETPAVRP